MKKLILTFFATAGIIALSYGQYVDQALIFSQQNYGSTARSKAMGNAFGAIGGDFSSLSINPAGIGIYLKPELSASLDILGIKNTESTYQGQMVDDRSTNFNFRNFGYVMTNPVSGNSGLVSFNFGIGFNKLNNFNQNLAVEKLGSPHSRMDAFASNSNGISSSRFYSENDPYYNGVPWESKLAWENYLINVSNPDQYGIGDQYQSFLYNDKLVNENLSISREGYNNEYIFSMGANFNHQLYLGATIGMQDLYYDETKNYSEDGDFGRFDYYDGDFGRFDYYNSESVRGFGYNLKFGVIYKPVPELRLGAAIHTPTFFDLKETYSAKMTSDLMNVNSNADGYHSELTPIGDYRYKMDSPMRAIGSVAYQFGKKGMLSIDYEYVDYSATRYRKDRDGYNFSEENTEIKNTYQAVSNLRFGGEFKPTNELSLRAGYELFGNPYDTMAYGNSQPNKDFSYNTINAGIGYRIDNVTLDISYTLGSKTDYNYIYQVTGYNDPVKNTMKNNELLFTLGIKL